MAFNRKYLYNVGAAAGQPARIWSYDTLDALTTVDDADYFVAAVKELQPFDIIFVRVWATAIGTGGTVTSSATAAAAIAVVLTSVPATPTVTTAVITKIATT